MARPNHIDLRILHTLVGNGRLNWRDFTQKVGLSPMPTLRRVCRLKEEHYIQSYFTRLDEERLSGAMSVFVSVSLEEQTDDHLARFEKHIVGAPQVMGCFQVTGDADYMLRVVVKDLAAYQVPLTNTLTCIPDVAGIKSAFALKSVMLRSTPSF